MRPAVSYIPYDSSPREQTGNIITSAQFEEGDLLSETRNNMESGNESDDGLTLAPLLSEEEIDAMSSGNESDAGPISTDMLEDISCRIQSSPSLNRREACYRIHYCFKQSQAECKGAVLSTQKFGKGLYKVFKAVVNNISQALPILGESG